ncbi:HU family DNA-binding protein [Ornithinimicrobium sp. LYQ92]|uniref:HU family DNA-binding protein n=1 Tax=Serinicoccus sp. LYQ92 TaxID=3378798 RepID=UPI0038532FCC
MNKSDLIEALAPRLGGRAAAAAAVEAVVDVVLREVAAGGTVGITGFGTFEQIERAPRTGRNPRTGEAVPIAGTPSPRFRPGSYFRDVVSDPGTLPAEGPAGVRVGSTGRTAPTASTAVAGAGTPTSVRRTSAGAAPGQEGSQKQRPRGQDRPRPATSGTPQTVRREPAPEPPAARTDLPDGAHTPPAAGPGTYPGGEDITAGMITAKKAQLARVKDDETAARKKADKKHKKDTKKKAKKKDGKKNKGTKG